MAVQKLKLSALTPRDLGALLSWDDAFFASNVSAHGTISHAMVKGMLSDEMFAQYATSQYAVYSYETAIAWRVQSQWYVNGDKYSTATNYHQDRVKAALTAIDIEYILL